MIRTTPIRTLALLLLGACGCSRKEPDAPAPVTACAGAPATIAGQIELAGELASARRGCVTVSAWPPCEAGREGAQPLLSRTYAIGDPDWCAGDGVQMRYFGLCDADRTGDRARALPGELEIEACFDPDGLVSTHQGRVLGSALARNGANDVLIRLAPRIETAQPTGSRKKGG